MAGKGFPPKDPSQKVRPTNDKVRRTELPADVTVAAPPLPPGQWGVQVVTWYQTWCESAQAQRFTGTDWQRLHMLAPLVEQYWADPSTKTLGEIRLNESLLGATEADRARLRWDLKPSVASGAPAVSSGVDERMRRLKVV